MIPNPRTTQLITIGGTPYTPYTSMLKCLLPTGGAFRVSERSGGLKLRRFPTLAERSACLAC